MNFEDRLRAMLGRADRAVEPQPLDWDGFVGRAHRRVSIRRSVAFAVAAAIVLAAGVGARALIEGRDLDTAPADELPRYDENPVDISDVAAECPVSAGFETGELGAVAYFRDGELHVVDLTTNQDRTLMTGLGETPSSGVRWSPDGRWISAGGYVVSAAGGEVCAPLGPDVSGVQWAGNDLMVAHGADVLIAGGPGREAREIDVEGASFLVDPETSRVAVGVVELQSRGVLGRAGIWLADPTTGRADEVADLTDGVPRIAGWSPDGEWILFWEVPLGSESLAADGATLYAVPVGGGEPVEVIDVMLPNRDFLTWCGDTLVAAAGADRDLAAGKRLATATAPDWNATELQQGRTGRSVFWPDCSPDGSWVAATSTSTDESNPSQAGRTIDIIQLTLGDQAGVSFGAPSEFPLWSRNHDPREQVILHVRRDNQDRATLFLDSDVADLGPVVGVYGDYRYSDLFAWYQP